MPPRLFVGVPTADGIVMADFVRSLAATLSALHAAGIATEYASIDGQDIGLQRGELVHHFLSGSCTHFLSLDSDMTFPADLARRLLDFDKAIVGAIYSKRALDLATLRHHARSHPFRDAFALSQSWNMRLAGAILRTEGELCRVEGIPSGFMLVRRDAMERVVTSTGNTGPFDEAEYRGEVLEGDYAFCRRAIDCGETIWAYPAADLGHLGDWRHGQPFAARLSAEGPSGRPAP